MLIVFNQPARRHRHAVAVEIPMSRMTFDKLTIGGFAVVVSAFMQTSLPSQSLRWD